jgi:hypothetical protein
MVAVVEQLPQTVDRGRRRARQRPAHLGECRVCFLRADARLAGGSAGSHSVGAAVPFRFDAGGFRPGRFPAKARERSLATRWSAPASFHGPPGRDAGGRREQDGERADCDRTCRRGGRWGVNSFQVPRPAGTFGWPPRTRPLCGHPNAPEGDLGSPSRGADRGPLLRALRKGRAGLAGTDVWTHSRRPTGKGCRRARPVLLSRAETCDPVRWSRIGGPPTQTLRVRGRCCSRTGPLGTGTWRIRAHSAGTENQRYSPF